MLAKPVVAKWNSVPPFSEISCLQSIGGEFKWSAANLQMVVDAFRWNVFASIQGLSKGKRKQKEKLKAL